MKIKQWLKIPWEKRVTLAVKNRGFSESDKRLSRLWITCPISELESVVDLKKGQLHLGPIDLNLVIDSLYFSKAVEENNIGLALTCIKSINKRVLALHNVEPWANLTKLKYKAPTKTKGKK